jgi:hypothetical protein
MAGSYHHLLPGQDDGPGWSMIENMGDAWECVEELFWLVESQIGRDNAEIALERFLAMKRGEVPKDVHMKFVDQQMSR